MPTDLDFIHQFIPGSSDRTLLLLHGTGGDENDLIPLGRELDPAAALLSPRGKVLENGHPRFFRRLAEGVFDLEDLKRRTDELADFVVAAAEHYHFDRAEAGRGRLFERREHCRQYLAAPSRRSAFGNLIARHGPVHAGGVARSQWSPGLDRWWNTGHDHSSREHRATGANTEHGWRRGYDAFLRRGSRPNEYRTRPGQTLARTVTRVRPASAPNAFRGGKQMRYGQLNRRFKLRFLQRGAIPFPEYRGCIVDALRELEQHFVGRRGGADRVIRQNKFAQRRII